MKTPLHLLKAWRDTVGRIARADRLVVLSDFDGTLVPIRTRRNDVRLPRHTRDLLQAIAERKNTLGIISGRSIEDLPSRVGVPDIWYAGSHGYFLQDPQGDQTSLLSDRAASMLKALALFLRLRFRNWQGFEVEPKRAAVALHHRRASKETCSLGYDVLIRMLARRKDLRLLCGKKVWEILPNEAVTKWTAARLILDREASITPNTFAIYFGDDVTDEAVFRNLRGVSVAVGKPRQTAADYWLASPQEVRDFLRRCQAVLNGRVAAALTC